MPAPPIYRSSFDSLKMDDYKLLSIGCVLRFCLTIYIQLDFERIVVYINHTLLAWKSINSPELKPMKFLLLLLCLYYL